jgi:hypothetical protein
MFAVSAAFSARSSSHHGSSFALLDLARPATHIVNRQARKHHGDDRNNSLSGPNPVSIFQKRMRYLLSLGGDVDRLVAKRFDQGITALFCEFDKIDERGQDFDRAFPLWVRYVTCAEIVDSGSLCKS